MSDTKNPADENAGLEAVYRSVFSLERGASYDQFLLRLVGINFFVLFCRPQDWPGLSFLGTAKVPFLLSAVVVFAALPVYSKSFHKIAKIMLFFLVFEAFRGVIGRYADPADTIVRNDFWQFHTWKDLILQFASLGFPLIAAMRSERGFRSMVFTIVVSGTFLGFYAATHNGKGPGGFLGDENDVCLVMVMMLPFAVMLRTSFRGIFFKLLCGIAAALLCVGIVATNSRGGFLGFAAVLGLFFIRSDRKVLTLAGGLVALLLAIPFIPQEYIQEIVSIRSDVGQNKGTVKERFDTWKVAFRVFKDPRHMPIGVGLNNVPFWFGEYEDVDRGRHIKSLSGRAMHSVYFQLLPDLGLYGVAVVGGVLWLSIIGNARSIRLYEHYGSGLRRLTQAPPKQSLRAVDQEHEQLLLAKRLLHQVSVGRGFAKTLNVAWLGTLAAGIGVSALYYPPIWFLACCSAAAQIHAQLLFRTSEALSEFSTAERSA